jgi:hypothetical protein
VKICNVPLYYAVHRKQIKRAFTMSVGEIEGSVWGINYEVYSMNLVLNSTRTNKLPNKTSACVISGLRESTLNVCLQSAFMCFKCI